MINWRLFGYTIFDKISERQLSYEQIAKEAGVSKSVLWRACKRLAIDSDNFVRLCLWADANPLRFMLGCEKWIKK
jgi:hypothetical protein